MLNLLTIKESLIIMDNLEIFVKSFINL